MRYNNPFILVYGWCKIRLLLLNPPAESLYVKEGRCQHKAAVFSSVYPPMTLAYMASMIRDVADVKLIDAMGASMIESSVLDEIKSFKPDLIVLNTTTPTFLHDMDFISRIRELVDCRVFVYGVHASSLWETVLNHGHVDGVIFGEPESTLEDLVSKPIEKVTGIAYVKNGRLIKNPSRSAMDLSCLPLPAWDLVDLSNYKVPVFGRKYVLITTGRGCPFECSFCVAPFYYGRKYRKRSVEDIIREIKHAVKLGVRDLYFFAETFTLDKSHVLDLCQAIIDEGLDVRWFCNSRVDTVDAEMFELMRASGCWMISFGLESSSQEVLDNIKKGIKVEDSKRAVKLAHDAGIATVGHFVFGLPGENIDTIRQTLRFSLDLPLDFAEYYVATPFPGSPLYERHKDDLDGKSWDSFEYANNVISKDMDLESARNKAYRRFYLRPRSITNMLRIFGVRELPSLIRTGVNFICNI